MYSIIGSRTASEAIPRGRHHKRMEVRVDSKLMIKRLPARRLYRKVTTSLVYMYMIKYIKMHIISLHENIQTQTIAVKVTTVEEYAPNTWMAHQRLKFVICKIKILNYFLYGIYPMNAE